MDGGVSLERYYRGLKWWELSGLGDSWLLRGRERDGWLLVWERPFPIVLQLSVRPQDPDILPRTQKMIKLLLISMHYIMNQYDRKEFSKISVAGSFMDIKSMAIYEKCQIFFTAVCFVYIQHLVWTFVVNVTNSSDSHWCGNYYVVSFRYCSYFVKGLEENFWKYLENKSSSDNGLPFLW